MAERRAITEADLRTAMRDPRYWQAGHPERQAFNDWVGEGWRALSAVEGAGDTRVVRVQAYRRVRNGRTEFVDGYDQRRSSGDQSEQTEALNRASLDRVREDAREIERERERRTFVAFVGGGGDAKFRNVRRVFDEAQVLGTLGERQIAYFSHTEGDRLASTIRALPVGTRVVVVGHSWGGDTAAQAVAALGAEGRPVATLVTVDPVGRFTSRGFFERVRAGTDDWTNIQATGGGTWERSNAVAALGRPYGSAVAAWADSHIEAPFAHGQFNDLLRHRDAGLASGWAAVLDR
jgi:hypothetical protein